MPDPVTPFDLLCENPEQFDGKVLRSRALIKTAPFFSRSNEEPKYIIELLSTTTSERPILLSVFEHPPRWLGLSVTSSWLLETLASPSDLFDPGQEIFFEGLVKIDRAGTVWINVPQVLIAHPSLAIGPREIIAARLCNRRYFLKYLKNVSAGSGLLPDRAVTRGNLVHSVIGHLLSSGGYAALSDLPPDQRAGRVRSVIDRVVAREFRFDLALHQMSGQSIESVIVKAQEHLLALLASLEASDLLRQGGTSEVQVPADAGFSGVIDLLIKGRPVELKTSHLDESRGYQPFRDHRWQVQCYLAARSLAGDGSDGCLLYSNPGGSDDPSDPAYLFPVELRDRDLDEILAARHRVLLMRRGRVLPRPSAEASCERCGFREPSKNQPALPAPCQFYCQVERSWACYHLSDEGSVKPDCPLFDGCAERLTYHDTTVIDQFSRLRKAIRLEQEARDGFEVMVQRIDAVHREDAGLVLPVLRLTAVQGDLVHFGPVASARTDDWHEGDEVRIRRTEPERTYLGRFAGAVGDELVVRMDGVVNPDFAGHDGVFVIERGLGRAPHLRRLLTLLDTMQRTGQAIAPPFTLRPADTTGEPEPYTPGALLAALEAYPIVVLESEPATDPEKPLMDLLGAYRAGRILVVVPDGIDRAEIVEQYPRPETVLSLHATSGLWPGDRSGEIGPEESSDQIARRLSKAEVIVTDLPFLMESPLISRLYDPLVEKYFSLVVVTRAETVPDAVLTRLRTLAARVLVIGDPHAVRRRVFDPEAKRLGLGISIMDRFALSYAGFASDEYHVLRRRIKSVPAKAVPLLERIGGKALPKHTAAIEFVGVNGLEVTPTLQASFAIPFGDHSLRYALRLRLVEPRDLASLPDLVRCATPDQRLHERVGGALELIERTTLGRIEGNSPTNAMVSVEIPLQGLPGLYEWFAYNSSEVEAVLDLVQSETSPGSIAVLTVTEAQASRLRSALAEAGSETPVLLPRSLRGRRYATVVVSLVTANAEHLPSQVLADPAVLYSILTAATDRLVLVGHVSTLRHLGILRELVPPPGPMEHAGA